MLVSDDHCAVCGKPAKKVDYQICLCKHHKDAAMVVCGERGASLGEFTKAPQRGVYALIVVGLALYLSAMIAGIYLVYFR